MSYHYKSFGIESFIQQPGTFTTAASTEPLRAEVTQPTSLTVEQLYMATPVVEGRTVKYPATREPMPDTRSEGTLPKYLKPQPAAGPESVFVEPTPTYLKPQTTLAPTGFICPSNPSQFPSLPPEQAMFCEQQYAAKQVIGPSAPSPTLLTPTGIAPWQDPAKYAQPVETPQLLPSEQQPQLATQYQQPQSIYDLYGSKTVFQQAAQAGLTAPQFSLSLKVPTGPAPQPYYPGSFPQAVPQMPKTTPAAPAPGILTDGGPYSPTLKSMIYPQMVPANYLQPKATASDSPTTTLAVVGGVAALALLLLGKK